MSEPTKQDQEKVKGFLVLGGIVVVLLGILAICDMQDQQSTSQASTHSTREEIPSQHSESNSEQSTESSGHLSSGLRAELRRACLASLTKAQQCGEPAGLGTTQEKLEALCPDLFRQSASEACLRENISFQTCASLNCDVIGRCSRFLTGSCN